MRLGMQLQFDIGWSFFFAGGFFRFPSGPLFLAIRCILELKCAICWAKIFHLHDLQHFGEKEETKSNKRNQETNKPRSWEDRSPTSHEVKKPQTPRIQKPQKPHKPQKLQKPTKKIPFKNSLNIVWFYRQKCEERSLDPSVNQTWQADLLWARRTEGFQREITIGHFANTSEWAQHDSTNWFHLPVTS